MTITEFTEARLNDEARKRFPRPSYEIESLRAILVEHQIRNGRCRICTAIANGHATRFRAPCWTLTNLAAIWRDHPDYESAWAPNQI